MTCLPSQKWGKEKTGGGLVGSGGEHVTGLRVYGFDGSNRPNNVTEERPPHSETINNY